MQVHAVPDSERAFDSTGRRLPWGFDFPDSENSKRRIPEERGPFGKARKRGVSRSKTPNISNAQDLAKQENLKHIDDIFAQYKADDKQKSLRKSSASQLPVSASAPNLFEAGGLSSSFQAGASTNGVKIPKEAILYGFGEGQQWAAISKFEDISNGKIYEEYERQPQDPKFGLSFVPPRELQKSKLSASQIGKINEYVGGDHWVKVTFDSAEAADRAIHWSPHTIWGYEVYAEEYRGVGPKDGDRPIPAGSLSLTASPATISSGTVHGGASQFSATASSATATSCAPARRTSRPRLGEWDPSFDFDVIPAQTSQALAPTSQDQSLAHITSAQHRHSGTSTLRLKSNSNLKVKLGEFKEGKVFLPTRPKWQETLGQFPVIGWFVGSGNGLIGDQVPRNADGKFDHTNASLYWQLWYAIDSCTGTDFCGVKEIEYDE
ncbi:uncharacterized protein N0V89_004365 [Didymosphaeria variabile]|uniref:Uncharacterized protein n=1 Tax=Didymosphaeria variabile TaxID=1932322 RepID=A0A9W9CD61_9PLEO|nr:uncharacterized protein N0V89_004365 [Didymosphaeria variabile]KAJ4356333.1 hypothetical protein N0V89_004365 [Didymosphaeria variabile]